MPATPSFLRLPPDARSRIARWGIAWLAWSALGVGEALLLWLTLPRRPAAPTAIVLVLGSAAWLWVATAPFVILLARAMPWPGTGRRARAAATLLAHATAALAIALLHTAWMRFAWMAFTPRVLEQSFATSLLARLDLHVFTYLAITGAVWAGAHWRRLREAGVQAARLRGELVRTRLHVLTMQLQPHFLFNTLHGISELVHRDPAAARRTAHHLRDLLQLSFAHAAHAEVPLREELRFLESYLGIQRTRFGEGLRSGVSVPPHLLDARVPCLVLQPLVENAIRHGLGARGGAGRVEVTAARRDGLLELVVRDDGRGLVGPRRERQGTGNTRVRIAQLYGDDGGFELRPAPGGGTEAVVTIPFREGDAASAREPDRAEAETTATVPAAATAGPADARPLRLDPTRRAAFGRAIAATVAAWGFWAAFWSAQAWALNVASGNRPIWFRLLYFNVGNAVLWAALTLPVAAAVRRWPARQERPWTRAALHVLFALLAAALLAVARWQLYFPERPFVAPGLAGWLAWDVITYAAVAAFAQGSLLAARRRGRETQVASLESDLARAELDVLKWQLRPAFLVETLDAIAAAAAHDPERADELTTRLGDLLRAMLQHVGSDEVPLSRELEMAEAYLDVQRLRAPDRLATEIVVDSFATEARVPGMLLLPLAEELMPSPAEPTPSRVRIEVRRRGARLEIVALGAPPADGFPSPGVERLRARLHAAYGDAQRVTESAAGPAERRVAIELPVLVVEERPVPSWVTDVRVGVPA